MKIFVIIIITLVLAYIYYHKTSNQEQIDYSGYIIIDVRTAGEFNSGHLENAINIPYDIIDQEIGKHVKDKNSDIMVYCRSGNRSGIAKKTLNKIGYKTFIIIFLIVLLKNLNKNG